MNDNIFDHNFVRTDKLCVRNPPLINTGIDCVVQTVSDDHINYTTTLYSLNRNGEISMKIYEKSVETYCVGMATHIGVYGEAEKLLEEYICQKRS